MQRGRAVGRAGPSPWAFREARGAQRLTGLAFAAAALGSGVAAAGLALAPRPGAAPGGALAIVGLLLLVIAQRQMGLAWRVGVRAGDAPLLVEAGLFRFSRNPIFVGMAAIVTGTAWAAGTVWGWVTALVFVATCHAQVRIEERHLAERFGPVYRAYCQRVPRWLGLPRAARGGT